LTRCSPRACPSTTRWVCSWGDTRALQQAPPPLATGTCTAAAPSAAAALTRIPPPQTTTTTTRSASRRKTRSGSWPTGPTWCRSWWRSCRARPTRRCGSSRRCCCASGWRGTGPSCLPRWVVGGAAACRVHSPRS
jgi:hypothetical protein